MPKKMVDLPVQAGVYTEQTARGAVGNWKDSDKVRFRYGLAEKIGGWTQVATTFIGLVRKIWDWTSLDTRKWSALGTEAKLYLYQSNALFDVTPLRRAVVLVDPFTTTNLSDLVDVNDPSHGAQVGDYVQFANANAVGGIIIDGEYRVEIVIDTNNFTIQDDQTATSSASGGGQVNAEYDIHIGLQSSAFGTGWGTGTWSQETWNTPRTTSTTFELLRTWSLDNWGEDLMAVPRGGSLYWWDRNTGNQARAVILPNAPEFINYMIISQRDRHIFALGCTDEFTGSFDPLLIRWCSKEDFGDWIPSSINTSGDLRLYRGSFIQAAIRTRGEILAFTDVSVHQINYLGGTAVYGIQTVGENVSILSPNAAIEVDYRVFFMAEADFYIYDGILRVMPSSVRNRVYENLTVNQKEKVFAGLNREFNEIWFFYPAKDVDVFWESNFTLSIEDDNYAKIDDTDAVNYDVTLNALGYSEIEASVEPVDGRTQGWIRIDGEALVTDPTEYEVQSKIQISLAAGSYRAFVVGNFFDSTGDDDEGGLAVGIDLGTNEAVILRKTLANTRWTAVSQVALGSLAPAITLTDLDEFTFTMVRNGSQITFNLYDETNDNYYADVAGGYTMTAQDLIDYAAGSYGLATENLSVIGTDGVLRLYSFAAGDLGSLSGNLAAATVSDEVDHYAVYNYQEETWAVGKMNRTAWADRSPVFNKPYAAGTDNILYKHETGSNDNGVAMEAYVETYDMEIPDAGEYLMHVDQLVPDFVDLAGTVNLKLKGKKYPQVADYQEKGPYPVTQSTRKISTRIRGRQIALRIESDTLNAAWRMGTLRARVTPHGKRA